MLTLESLKLQSYKILINYEIYIIDKISRITTLIFSFCLNHIVKKVKSLHYYLCNNIDRCNNERYKMLKLNDSQIRITSTL